MHYGTQLIESLNVMRQHFRGDQELANAEENLEFMGALPSGKMTPVCLLHCKHTGLPEPVFQPFGMWTDSLTLLHTCIILQSSH